MGYIDIVLGALMIIGAIRGFMKGFISQLFGLAALFIGIFGAIKLSGWASGKIAAVVNTNSDTLPLVSFLVVFFTLVIVVLLIGKLVDGMVESSKLGIPNRIIGALFSITKVALILSVVLWTFTYFDSKTGVLPKKAIEESYLYKPISKFAPTVVPLLRIDEIKIPLHESTPDNNQDKPTK